MSTSSVYQETAGSFDSRTRGKFNNKVSWPLRLFFFFFWRCVLRLCPFTFGSCFLTSLITIICANDCVRGTRSDPRLWWIKMAASFWLIGLEINVFKCSVIWQVCLWTCTPVSLKFIFMTGCWFYHSSCAWFSLWRFGLYCSTWC